MSRAVFILYDASHHLYMFCSRHAVWTVYINLIAVGVALCQQSLLGGTFGSAAPVFVLSSGSVHHYFDAAAAAVCAAVAVLWCGTGDPDHPGLSIAWGACGHVFHLDCIQRWLKTRSACPLCNKEWDFAKIERILAGRLFVSCSNQSWQPGVNWSYQIAQNSQLVAGTDF